MSTSPMIPQQWVASAPFRAHFHLLLEDTGLPWRVLALAINLPVPLARRLALSPPGRHRMRVADARRIIAVTPQDLSRLSVEQDSCRGTARRLQALQADGFDPLVLARGSGLTPAQVSDMITGRIHRASRLTILRAQALADEIQESALTGQLRLASHAA